MCFFVCVCVFLFFFGGGGGAAAAASMELIPSSFSAASFIRF